MNSSMCFTIYIIQLPVPNSQTRQLQLLSTLSEPTKHPPDTNEDLVSRSFRNMTRIHVSHLGNAIEKLSVRIFSQTSSSSSICEVRVQTSATGKYASQLSEATHHRIQARRLSTQFDSADVHQQIVAIEEKERDSGIVDLGISIHQQHSTDAGTHSVDDNSDIGSLRRLILTTLESIAREDDNAPRSDGNASLPAPYESSISPTRIEWGNRGLARLPHNGSDSNRISARTRKRHGHVDRRGQVFLANPTSHPPPPGLAVPTPDYRDYASNSSPHQAHPMRRQHGRPHRHGIADFSSMRFSTDGIGSPR